MYVSYCESGQEPMAGVFISTIRELRTIILQKGSVKLPSKCICLYPQINAALSPHQRSFFMRLITVNTETHRWSE